MNREQILSAIHRLAASKGFYSGLYKVLTNGTEESEKFLDAMEKQNFADAVDMVLWLEC